MKTNTVPPSTTPASMYEFLQRRRLTVMLFKPKSPFSWLLVVLQTFVGGNLQSACHVKYGYNGKCYNITTEGTYLESVDSNFHLCDDAYFLNLNKDQAEDAKAYFDMLEKVALRFSLLETVLYFLLRLIPATNLIIPFTCASPLADLDLIDLDYNCATPAFVEQCLANTATEEE
jgi:hypothetical protein